MKLLKNRMFGSVVFGVLITALAFSTYVFILKPGSKNQFERTTSGKKKFVVELNFDINTTNLSLDDSKQYVFNNEIEALKNKALGIGSSQSIYFTKDHKIKAIFNGVSASDTSLLITSFHLPVSVGFWETYALNQQIPTIEQLFKLAGGPDGGLIHPPDMTGGVENYLVQLAYVKRKDTGVVRRILSDTNFRKLAPLDAVYLFGNSTGPKRETYCSIYAIKNRNVSTNSSRLNETHIKYASVNFSHSDFVEINVTFTSSGSRIFGELTKRNSGRAIALTINNFVVSAPRVYEPIFGGNISITGNFAPAEAASLAFKLRGKPLPFPITLIRHETKEVKDPFYKRYQAYLIFLASAIVLSLMIYYIYPLLSYENKSF